VESRAENMRVKMPYSTPSLTPNSLSGLAGRIPNRDAQGGKSIEKRLLGPGTHPPLLVFEGFDGDAGELTQVLSSIVWRPEPGSDLRRAGTLETPAEKSPGLREDGICILLVDTRHRYSGGRQPLTRIETESGSCGIITLILTDSADGITTDSQIRPTDRWHFSGAFTPASMGALVKSVFQIWTAWVATPVSLGSDQKITNSKSSVVAFAERD
jgi:hypothetical protein